MIDLHERQLLEELERQRRLAEDRRREEQEWEDCMWEAQMKGGNAWPDSKGETAAAARLRG